MGEIVTMPAADEIFYDDETAHSTQFPDNWRLLDDVQLLELPDPEYLIEGILQRRGVGVVYAPSGARRRRGRDRSHSPNAS
jgi:hypothetical protein